jgi:hypothetical protein
MHSIALAQHFSTAAFSYVPGVIMNKNAQAKGLVASWAMLQ